jgi:DNA-binding beta-propeller fold protein YncE
MLPRSHASALRAFALAAFSIGCTEAPDTFDRPTAVAFDPATREVVVSDGYNHARVARFSPDGHFRSAFGERGAGDGELRTPHGIAVDADGRIYVADRENARVQIFDRSGKVVAIWNSSLVGRPWAVAIADGFVYVVDGGDQDPEHPRGGLVKLTREGRVLARLQTSTRMGLDGAHAVAVGQDGAVYIAESDGRRVRKLVPAPKR